MRKLSRRFVVRDLPDDLWMNFKIEAAKQDINLLQAALKAFQAFAEGKIKLGGGQHNDQHAEN